MLKSVNLLPRSACSKTIMNMKFEQMSRLIKYETISVSPSVCLAAQDVLAAGDHLVKSSYDGAAGTFLCERAKEKIFKATGSPTRR